ncbi:MAG: phasin family protein [Cellvibrionaceae bacterium]
MGKVVEKTETEEKPEIKAESKLLEDTEMNTETENLDSMPKKSSRIVKVISGVGSAYKFAWYTCLGTALTVEETVTDFSKKMAVKGAGVDLKPSLITKRFEAPKAKIDHARAEFKSKAQEKIVGVEHALDEGVNRSLHFIGVPSRKDMNQMTSLMQDMAESITELSSQLQNQKPAPASRAKKAKADGQTSVA